MRKKDSCRVNNKSNGTERAKAIAGPQTIYPFIKPCMQGLAFERKIEGARGIRVL